MTTQPAQYTVREVMLQRIEAAIGSTDLDVQYEARCAIVTLRQNRGLDEIYVDFPATCEELFGLESPE